VALKEPDLIGHNLFEVRVEVRLEVGAVIREHFPVGYAGHDFLGFCVRGAQLDAEVMIGTFAVEGLLMHPLSEEQQRAICDALVAHWIPTPAL
jgi:hypothetical protein